MYIYIQILMVTPKDTFVFVLGFGFRVRIECVDEDGSRQRDVALMMYTSGLRDAV